MYCCSFASAICHVTWFGCEFSASRVRTWLVGKSVKVVLRDLPISPEESAHFHILHHAENTHYTHQVSLLGPKRSDGLALAPRIQDHMGHVSRVDASESRHWYHSQTCPDRESQWIWVNLSESKSSLKNFGWNLAGSSGRQFAPLRVGSFDGDLPALQWKLLYMDVGIYLSHLKQIKRLVCRCLVECYTFAFPDRSGCHLMLKAVDGHSWTSIIGHEPP